MDLFSISIQKKKRHQQRAMTAKCIMIYLWLSDGWFIFRCDRKYLLWHGAFEWDIYTRNCICSDSFHIPSNLCRHHSHIYPSTNYMSAGIVFRLHLLCSHRLILKSIRMFASVQQDSGVTHCAVNLFVLIILRGSVCKRREIWNYFSRSCFYGKECHFHLNLNFKFFSVFCGMENMVGSYGNYGHAFCWRMCRQLSWTWGVSFHGNNNNIKFQTATFEFLLFQ